MKEPVCIDETLGDDAVGDSIPELRTYALNNSATIESWIPSTLERLESSTNAHGIDECVGEKGSRYSAIRG